MITRSTVQAIHTSSIPAAPLVVRVIMQAAFDLVADPDDWRGPIDARVNLDAHVFDADVVADSIDYVTATPATVTDLGGGVFGFTALGYRLGPAGDDAEAPRGEHAARRVFR